MENIILNTKLEGSIFVQDKDSPFITIDNVVISDSPKYRYRSMTACLTELINEALNDPLVVVLLYNKKSSKGYLRTGFDLESKTDYSKNIHFKTYVLKERAVPFVKKPIRDTIKTTEKEWNPNFYKYKNNDIVTFNGLFYKCINSHKSQVDWSPDIALSLWLQINLLMDKDAVPAVITQLPEIIKDTVPDKFCAPYIDTCLWPTFNMVDCYRKTGNKFYTLGFIVSQGNKPSVGGYYLIEQKFYLDQIQILRSYGGDVIMSFGGANGIYLAIAITDISELVDAYQSVIDTYSLKMLDFDIEGAGILGESIDRRNKALFILKQRNPGLQISYTLPVMPTGLSLDGVSLLKNAKLNGVEISRLNIMAMDYGQKNREMGQAAISACKNTKTQLELNGYKNTTIGITPMIGKNDTENEIFSIQNAFELSYFVNNTSYISMVSYWSLNRDIRQNNDGVVPLYNYSSVTQTDYNFLTIFKSNL